MKKKDLKKLYQTTVAERNMAWAHLKRVREIQKETERELQDATFLRRLRWLVWGYMPGE